MKVPQTSDFILQTSGPRISNFVLQTSYSTRSLPTGVSAGWDSRYCLQCELGRRPGDKGADDARHQWIVARVSRCTIVARRSQRLDGDDTAPRAAIIVTPIVS